MDQIRADGRLNWQSIMASRPTTLTKRSRSITVVHVEVDSSHFFILLIWMLVTVYIWGNNLPWSFVMVTYTGSALGEPTGASKVTRAKSLSRVSTTSFSALWSNWIMSWTLFISNFESMYTVDQSKGTAALNQSSQWAEMAAHDALKSPDFRDSSASSTFTYDALFKLVYLSSLNLIQYFHL